MDKERIEPPPGALEEKFTPMELAYEYGYLKGRKHQREGVDPMPGEHKEVRKAEIANAIKHAAKLEPSADEIRQGASGDIGLVPRDMPEQTSPADRTPAQIAIEAVLDEARKVPSEQRGKFFTMVATTAISVIHGTYGKQFAHGYLTAALGSLDDPTTVIFREPTKQ